MNSPYQYNQEFCIVECLQQKVLQTCNCTFPSFFSLSGKSCPNVDQFNCGSGYFYYPKLLEPISLTCSAQCPLECNSTEYTFEMSSQRVYGNGYIHFIKENPNLSADFDTTHINSETVSNKFVQLYAYYDSLTYTFSTDTPSMDIVSFLANIGGTLGLFLGLSLLSVCELIHVLVEIVMATITKI